MKKLKKTKIQTKKPRVIKVQLTIECSEYTDAWDDDVDWTNPQKVIENQIDCVDWREFSQDGVCTKVVAKVIK